MHFPFIKRLLLLLLLLKLVNVCGWCCCFCCSWTCCCSCNWPPSCGPHFGCFCSCCSRPKKLPLEWSTHASPYGRTALSWPATPPLGPPLCLEKFRVCMLIKVITWRTPPKRKQKPKWRAAANCTQHKKKKNKLSGRILSTLSIW